MEKIKTELEKKLSELTGKTNIRLKKTETFK